MKSIQCIIVLAVVASVATHGQATFTVPSAAHPTIQSAIDAAVNGDTVFVSAGMYVERIDFDGKAISVFGQGPGQSIIDGNQLGSVVTFQNGEGPNSVLDGFTITNGSGSPTVISVLPELAGGGISITSNFPGVGVGPVINNCEITGNSANTGGGIVLLRQGSVTISNCNIHNNQSVQNGGGISAFLSSPIFQNSVIRSNTGSVGGGIASTDTMTIEGCTIQANTAIVGGGIAAGSSTVDIDNSIIVNNTATSSHGGALVFQSTMKNVVVAGNSSVMGGAAVAGISFTFVNSTITQNSSGPQGAIIRAVMSLNIENSILWGNTGTLVQSNGPASMPAIAAMYSNVQGGLPGAGNIDTDPSFVDAFNDDFHLTTESPCVNAADGTNPNLPTIDIDGEPRSLFGTPDMGADEASDIALHPSMAGTVGLGSGGPFDVLQVNGQIGGTNRRVPLSTNQPLNISVSQPSSNPASANFAIFGVFGIPRFSDPFALPGGIGEIAVFPCPLLPFFEPVLFTLTDNFPIGLCNQIIPSTPTPWMTGLQPGIPFPVSITLQGLIVDGPNSLAVTNGVILVVQ